MSPTNAATVAANLNITSVSGDPNAADTLSEGQFIAYAAVFGNVDTAGDVMAPGAFTRTLQEWADSGDSIPLLWGHNMDDPDFNVGHVVNAVEDDHGLRVTGQIDLDSPKGDQTLRLLRGRRVREMSFAFIARDTEDAVVDGALARRVLDVDLIEVSIVPIGANSKARVQTVKSHPAPATTPRSETTMNPEMKTMADFAAYRDEANRLAALQTKGEPGATDALRRLLDSNDYKATAARARALIADAESGPLGAPNFAGTHTDTTAHRGPAVGTKNALVSGPAALNTKARDLAAKIEAKATDPNGISSGGELLDNVLVSTDVLADGRPAGGLLEAIGSKKVAPNFGYIRQTLRENNAAAVPVGTDKPTSRYTAERVAAALRVWAHISDGVDAYVLRDAPSLAMWLADEMRYGLVDALETAAVLDLIAKAGTTQAYRGDLLATTRAALTHLQNEGLEPSVFALSPADWETIELSAASGSGEYRFNSAPVNSADHLLWSVPVAVVPGMTAGKGVLVAKDSATIYTDEDLRIDWDSAGDLFNKNQTRLRVETRALPAVNRPAGVVAIDTTAPTAP